MIPSLLFNAAIAVCTVTAVLRHLRHAEARLLFRYFTVLSNLFCAVAALAVVLCRLSGVLPLGVLLGKYVGTAAVSVTMLTVLVFLGPSFGYRPLLSGPDLWLHLICPLMAIVSFLCWDRPPLPFAAVFLGMLPVLLYGSWYLYRVVYAPEDRRWEDFYGFNRDGKWPISFALMALGAFIISLLLRL